MQTKYDSVKQIRFFTDACTDSCSLQLAIVSDEHEPVHASVKIKPAKCMIKIAGSWKLNPSRLINFTDSSLLIPIQCNLDYPDPFVHQLIAAIPDK